MVFLIVVIINYFKSIFLGLVILIKLTLMIKTLEYTILGSYFDNNNIFYLFNFFYWGF